MQDFASSSKKLLPPAKVFFFFLIWFIHKEIRNLMDVYVYHMLLGHPQSGGLYRSARDPVVCRGHSLRLGNSGWSSLALGVGSQ